MQAGLVAPGLEPVEAAFGVVLDGQLGTGAALAVWGEGRWLVDLWGGLRRVTAPGVATASFSRTR